MPMNINYITIITLGGIKKKNLKPKKNDKTVWTTKQAGRFGFGFTTMTEIIIKALVLLGPFRPGLDLVYSTQFS